MPRTARRRVAEGVYEDKYSLTAIVAVGTGPDKWVVEQAFAKDTATQEIQEWRDEQRVRMRKERPNVARGTFAADVPIYLKSQEHKVSYSAKKSELNAWAAELGHLRRHQVKGKHLTAVFSTWLEAGISKKTILNRCRTLHHLYVTLADDKKVRTPLDNVEIPRPDKSRPKHVADSLIVRTEKQLRKQLERDAAAAEAHLARGPKAGARRPFEATQANLQRNILDSARARARFMVMATAGIRPSQLKRLTKAYVDLRRRVVDIAGGKGGEPIVQVMNDEMLIAWRAFVAADAWGSYDDSKFRRRLKAAGWPAGLPPYNTKHAIGFALSERGADREDIKDWFGHTDMKSTRVYTAASLKRIRKVSASVDGRFGWKNAPSDAPSLDRRTSQNVADLRLKRDNAIAERRQAIRSRRGLKSA